jgi:hypothetical protein
MYNYSTVRHDMICTVIVSASHLGLFLIVPGLFAFSYNFTLLCNAYHNTVHYNSCFGPFAGQLTASALQANTSLLFNCKLKALRALVTILQPTPSKHAAVAAQS